MPENMDEFNMCRKWPPMTKEFVMGTVRCNYCHNRGHMKFNCCKRLKLCFACHVPGHYIAQCEQPWRLRIQGANINRTRKLWCWNCNGHGHQKWQCLQGRQEHSNHRQCPRVAATARKLPVFGTTTVHKYEASYEQENLLRCSMQKMKLPCCLY